MRFLPESSVLLILKGDIRHKNVWQIDLETGAERQLTNLAPDFEARDFDRELVLERAQAHSQIVLIEMP